VIYLFSYLVSTILSPLRVEESGVQIVSVQFVDAYGFVFVYKKRPWLSRKREISAFGTITPYLRKEKHTVQFEFLEAAVLYDLQTELLTKFSWCENSFW